MNFLVVKINLSLLKIRK